MKKIKILSIFIFLFSIVNLEANESDFNNWLISFKQPGSGPNKNQRLNNWFKAVFIGKGENETVKTIISGGDPGYGETSKFISEIALCIINEFDKLNKKKGILTPIECTGDLLIDRLKNAGLKFK